MTQDEKRIAIAEACGVELQEHDWQVTTEHKWATCFNCGRAMCLTSSKESEDAEDALPCLPDYLNDLNAMHAAEKMLTDEQFERYEIILANVAGNTDGFGSLKRQRCKVSATAARRAEAFGLTLKLWEPDSNQS